MRLRPRGPSCCRAPAPRALPHLRGGTRRDDTCLGRARGAGRQTCPVRTVPPCSPVFPRAAHAQRTSLGPHWRGLRAPAGRHGLTDPPSPVTAVWARAPMAVSFAGLVPDGGHDGAGLCPHRRNLSLFHGVSGLQEVRHVGFPVGPPVPERRAFCVVGARRAAYRKKREKLRSGLLSAPGRSARTGRWPWS